VNVGEQPPAMTPYGALYRQPATAALRARALARDAIRSFGQLTAGMRSLPDYLIIGTKRGGTTSLARWLLEHPDVKPLFPARETRKGTYYFDVNYNRGQSWYLSHFPTRRHRARAERQARRQLLLGEATPYYLYHPHAAIRARQIVPGARIIALLRHPVDRAYGHWAERYRQGVEPLGFPAAVEAEERRLAGEERRMLADPAYVSFAHQHHSYVDQSRYARGLARWMSAFPPGQVLVLRSEDLFADPIPVYHQVLAFLGLAARVPDGLAGWNRKPKTGIDPDLRRELQALLAPDIQAVEELLNRPMDWT
jgi:hypothetical protein